MRAGQQLLAQADSAFKVRDFKTAEPLYQQALDAAEKENDTSVRIEALSQLARCNLTQNRKEPAVAWLKKAETVADSAFPLGWTRFLGVRGRYEWRADNLAAARKTFGEMIEYAEAHGLTDRMIDASVMMGLVVTPEESIPVNLRTIAFAEKAKSFGSLGPLFNNLAGAYCDTKDYQRAYDAYVKAREYHWQYGDETNKLFADYSIGWVLRLLGRYDEALTWLRPTLAWSERLGNASAQGQCYQDIGEIMAAKGNKKEALEYFEQAEASYVRAGYAENNPDVLNEVRQRLAALRR